ncbi:phosphatidylinositol 5-phosphate 4-kinase type-2 alpha isoform X1 [Dermacentor andersoni]|uniref:phosphatidylinositol 5-phosphate 4-kinase type-2 alpha isoform X1 n=1 Tax=Dermacentor andersoni TaxID=34620 RepID=UPI00215517D9|nr:phosphatidylinositol 5-phosphate 4-kinase type-2 alpha-like isoform X1 [Dermacentor andersoni]
MSGIASGLTTKGSSRLKKKHFKPKHQKAKLFRANEPLLSVFMWGVNHTINGLTHVNVPVMLMPDDFKAFTKIKVDNHHFNKENMPSHFKVKEYCPLVFRNLRERFGIDDIDFINSITKSQPIAVDSTGRSGAKFYQSYDRLFIIKTLLSEEVEQMHVLLKEYHPYVVERHGKTLLPQYLGMYRLTVEGAETYLVVIRNIFSSHLNVHVKYDLKGYLSAKPRPLLKHRSSSGLIQGSTVDREASEKEREKDIPTLKDNDLMKDGTKVHIGADAKERFLELLTADVNFLAQMNVMDYSLCLGIHDVERAEQEALERERVEALMEEADNGTGGSDALPQSEEDEDSAGSGLGDAVPTPPDSPGGRFRNELGISNGLFNPARDIYAISSLDGAGKKEVYFMALVDVLTHYGVKKRTAQAAKTMKHGAGAEISTVHPEQYAKRFLDFISKAID